MATLLEYALPVVMAGVALVIAMGLWNMAKGGSANWSQKLMRLRVIIQFAAIIMIMGILYFRTPV